jgi:hypothetical protein
MKAIAGSAARGPVVSSAVVMGALAILTVAILSGQAPPELAPVLAVVIVAALAYRSLLLWRNLLALVILVVLFIPARRYALPGSLPFELDPYRLLVAFILLGWTASLLIDPRVRLKRSGLEAPILLFLVAAIASVFANRSRVTSLESAVLKEFTFFLSFLVVFFLIVSVVRRHDEVDFLVKFLVGGGAIVAAFAVIEARTRYNVFNDLGRVIPLLDLTGIPSGSKYDPRGLRSVGSAQHPIALGAALVMLIPAAVYLVHRSRQRRWWLAAGLLGIGALATVSRTSIVMLLVVGLVFFWLRPSEVKRLWPAVLPALLVVHFALPGTLGTVKNSFFPEGGLLAEQKREGGAGQGRIADLGPALSEWSEQPLFGQGYGTRTVEDLRRNVQILDNQWLGTLLETGLAGAIAWFWLVARSIRRFATGAKEDPSSRGWLLTAVVASIAAFSVGMLLYDAFAFTQVTLLFFILLGFGCVLVAREDPAGERRARAWLPSLGAERAPAARALGSPVHGGSS